MKRLNNVEIEYIIKLRQTGHSLPEIRKLTNRGNATIHRYIQEVAVLPKYIQILKDKQGGSKVRSFKKWQDSELNAKNLIGNIKNRDLLFILSCLYWGEGNKKELNLVNSDPDLIRIFIKCLEEIGIQKEDLRITLRVYSDLDKDVVRKYWANLLKIPLNQILNVNVLYGKKEGKLKYGMCRVRVTKSEYYFKLIMSLIKEIKKSL